MIRWQQVGRAALTLLTIGTMAASASALGKVKAPPDFNGDGFDDLAIGVPKETYSSPWSFPQAGIVQVIYGRPAGLYEAANQIISRKGRTSSHPLPPRSNARFGTAIAWGDFNGDGFDDLAVGAPFDNSGRGSVEIWFGSVNGLTQPGQLLWRQVVDGIAGQNNENFGASLAVGDVDGDGFDDLALSRTYTGNGRGSLITRGVVYILRGSATGLRNTAPQTLNYNINGPYVMTFGDFNGDGHDDLAMGYPFNGTGGQVWIGSGTPYGIDSNPQIITQDTNEAGFDLPEQGDHFGYSLAAGDFNDDGGAELVVGAPGENGSKGVVHVIWSTGASGQIWSQDAPGVFEVAEAGDRFGESLAVGHLYLDNGLHRTPEIFIGVPGENSGRGAVQVIAPIGGQLDFWTLESYNIAGVSLANDRFGTAIALGDYNGDGYGDLVIGVPGRNGGAGWCTVIYAHTWPGNHPIAQGYAGFLDTSEAGDNVGSVL